MKKVLITGGTRGIGRAMVERFARNGWEVAFTYCSSEASAQQLCERFSHLTRMAAFQCDFSHIESANRLADSVLDKFGTIDALINNAAISSYGLFQDLGEDEIDRLLNVNVKSLILLTKRIVPSMISKHSGTIINLSSVWGQTGASCEVLYSMSKAAVIGFTKALAKELAPSGVCVNCIAPGVVDTDMLSKFSEEEKEAMRSELPHGEFSAPSDIAELALFLAENRIPSLLGQVIAVNGGMYC